MKKFLFITDFDGTVTAQDFFQQIIFRYKPQKAFISENKRGFELLSEVFSGLNLTETELLDEIKHAPIDFSFADFVKFVRRIGGRVLILSAGAKYYVENKLRFEGLIDEVEVIANESFYCDGGIKLIRNENDRFYDEQFGIDKLKIVEYYKTKFDVLAYAGDSYVDFDGCRLCDFRFAKKNLAKILDLFHIKHSKFVNFSEIKSILKKNFY